MKRLKLSLGVIKLGFGMNKGTREMSYPDTTNYDGLEKSICKYFWNKVSVNLSEKDRDKLEADMYDKFSKAAAEYVRLALTQIQNKVLNDLRGDQ